MTTGSGDKPGGGSTAPGGRPAADTPQRLVVRSTPDSGDSAAFGANDTAVALSKASSTDTPLAGTPALPPQSELVGSTLSGRYMVTRKIGQGGMGAVYEAKHTAIGGRFAVKVLLDKYAQREAIVARLKQEAQLATSLDHEHIIRVTDFGSTDDGRTFVVMEFLEGESLAELLSRETKLPEQRILRIASQAASALAAAHAKGIVHRDIKPENLFIIKRKEQDFVKIVDFGISKNLRASDEQEEQPRLTQTGMVLGTPLYMSPEQARGDEDLDHRVDIYALGVIMYETATGRVPFAGTNYLSVISQVLNDEPKPVREVRPEISDEFEAIVQRAMAKNRDDRYASANALLEDLNALLDDPTRSTERAKITGPRRRFPARPKIPKLAWAIGGIGLLVAAVTIAVVMMNGGPPKKQVPQTGVVPPPVLVDAAVLAPPVVIDAAPVEPATKTIKLHVVTDPPGGMVYKESEELGPAPYDFVLVRKDKDIKISATLAGGYYGEVTINPVEESGDTKKIVLHLEKKKPPVTFKPHPTGAGSGSAVQATHPSDIGTNPYKLNNK
jgi:predicted Ser/Thr protein kinase